MQKLFDDVLSASAAVRRPKSRIKGYLLAFMLLGVFAAPVVAADVVSKVAYKADGTVVTTVKAGDVVKYVISVNSTTNSNPAGDVVLKDTMSSNQTYIANTLVKSGGGWTLANPAGGSTFNNTTLGTWGGTANQPVLGGPSVFLYGSNADLAQATVPPLPTLNYVPPLVGDGYTPFIVYASNGNMILSGISHHMSGTVTVACSNLTAGTSCTTSVAGSSGNWPSPTLIGSKVYYQQQGGAIGCLDYASGTPVSCGSVVVNSNAGGSDPTVVTMGPILAGGKLYLLSTTSNGRFSLGCLDPATGGVCAGSTSTGTIVSTGAAPGTSYAFISTWVNLGNGSLVFSNDLGTFCISITGPTTATQCNGTAFGAFAPTATRNSLVLINNAGTVGGFCYGNSLSTPTSCRTPTLSVTTTYGLTLPATDANTGNGSSWSGDAFVTGTSRVVYSLGYQHAEPTMRCWDFATNSSCGSASTSPVQKPYGTAPLPNSTCVVSLGDVAAAGFQFFDAATTLTKVPLSSCYTVTGTVPFVFSDPAPRYCGPTSGVSDWGSLVLSVSAGVIPVGTVITFKNPATGTTIGTVTVTAAQGGGTNIVTIPKSAFPAAVTYASYPSLAIALTTTTSMTSGATMTARLNTATTNGGFPEICYQATVTNCSVSTSNTAIVDGVGSTFDASGSVSLSCLATANLAITKTNTPGVNNDVDQANDTVTSNSATVYFIVVSNAGPDAANGSIVKDTAIGGLACTQATCTSTSGGATCPVETGAALLSGLQGSGVAIPQLPVGGRVTLTLTCTVP